MALGPHTRGVMNHITHLQWAVERRLKSSQLSPGLRLMVAHHLGYICGLMDGCGSPIPLLYGSGASQGLMLGPALGIPMSSSNICLLREAIGSSICLCFKPVRLAPLETEAPPLS